MQTCLTIVIIIILYSSHCGAAKVMGRESVGWSKSPDENEYIESGKNGC